MLVYNSHNGQTSSCPFLEGEEELTLAICKAEERMAGVVDWDGCGGSDEGHGDRNSCSS
jgi:hypothetical protein